jgi:hypothetical protein
MLPCVHFTAIWIVAVVAVSRAGECPEPVALAAIEILGNDIIEVASPRLLALKRPPYPTGQDTLLITVDAHVLAGVHQVLGWRMPERLIDLLIEHRNAINGHSGARVGGLVGALLSYGRPASDALVGDTTSQHLRRRLSAVQALLQAMGPELDVGRALLRGRYLCAASRIEATGIPIDRDALGSLRQDWPGIRGRVIDDIDRAFGAYRAERFDEEAFASWLVRRGIDWPVTKTGRLDLTDETWRDMARLHPQVRPLKELRTTLLSFDPHSMAVGCDGRNRTPVRPFSTVTGRNAPSARASALGSAAWVRHLIKPAPGTALAMIDFDGQEFGIAAALSGDEAMQTAYLSDDPYLSLARAAGAAPTDATASTHADLRNRYKACALGVQYGIGPVRLARQLGIAEREARTLLEDHRRAFPSFWEWSSEITTQALLYGKQLSVFGWRRLVISPVKETSLRNFPMQANGAEILRLACCSVTEAGITVCAPNHDALLIEAPMGNLADAVATTQRLMAEASKIVLDGFTLRTSVKTVAAPDRWQDQRGQAVWSAVASAIGLDEAPAHQRNAT